MRAFLLLGFAVAVLAIVGVEDMSGQRRELSPHEYRSAVFDERKQATDRPVRQVSDVQRFENGTVILSERTVLEYATTGSFRRVIKTVDRGTARETEEIKIGDTVYSRNDGGPWAKIKLNTRGTWASTGRGIGTAAGSGSCRLEQFSIDEVMLGDAKAELFEEFRVASIYNSGRQQIEFTETRYWFDLNKDLIKYESVIGSFHPRKETERTVTTYEYDPKIKIEAPSGS